MLEIDNQTKQINITRGDYGVISVSAINNEGKDYEFQIGDVVRLKVFKKRDFNYRELQKDVTVDKATTTVDIELTKEDTKIGDVINKPVEYWYEIELNPNTKPQTIIGYDEDGEKKFVLYPEGSDGK